MTTADELLSGIESDAEVDEAIALAQAAHRTKRSRWHRDPVSFAREALGITLTETQADVVRRVAAHGLTSWRAGQKLGKSTVIAVIALWWAYTRDHGLVVMTSGNAAQVRIILWRELRRLYTKALVDLGGELHLAPENGLRWPDGRLIVGITADQPERLQGYSGANLLFLVDEASGFSDELLEAVIGNLAGGGHALLCGNPTKTVGLFAKTHRAKLAGWQLIHSSALDSPNVKAGRVVVDGLAKPEWVQQMIDTFGVDSAAFAVRVKGEFAEEGEDSVVPLAYVTEAVSRWTPTSTELTHPLEVGVDPARFGDDETVIVARRGEAGYPEVACRKLDNVEVAAKVIEVLFGDGGIARPSERPTVRIDVGGLGAGVVDILRRDSRIRVVAVNAAEESRFPDRFRNTRAELWWCLRMWLKRGGMLPPDDKRDAEMLAAKYRHDVKLRIEIGSKDDMRKELGRSPDRADAWCLGVYGESPLEERASIKSAPVSQIAPPPRRYGDEMPASSGAWQPGMGPPTRRHGW